MSAPAADADRRAALRWVIAAGLDPDKRAEAAPAKLEKRPAGKEPLPRSAEHERYLRELGLHEGSRDAPRAHCSNATESRAAPGARRMKRSPPDEGGPKVSMS
jgi:hypothetical protein